MATDPNSPSVGIDAKTGKMLTGWEHVLQSIDIIFSTSFGERVQREFFGSLVGHLLGKLLTPREVVPYFASIVATVEQFEPRFRVTKITPLEVTREGLFRFALDGVYRPRALQGDFTPEGNRRVGGYISDEGRIRAQNV
jgi:uncharacterized protein